MKIKIVLISLLSLILYTILLSCVGVFGGTIQSVVFHYGLIIGKWLLIGFGFFLCIFLPIRVTTALKKNEENKYYAESDEKIRQAGIEKKALEEKIMQEYYKSEDAI